MDINDIANVCLGVLFGLIIQAGYHLITIARENPTGRKELKPKYRVRIAPYIASQTLYTKCLVDRKTWRGWVCVGEVGTLMQGREYANALANPVVEVIKGE